MNTPVKNSSRLSLFLAILCTVMLIYIMVGLPIYTKEVFQYRGTINTGGELAILIGFVSVLLFNVASLVWVGLRLRRKRETQIGDWRVFAFGGLCLILHVGEKAMIDEIGREYGLGSEVLGEWIALYVDLAIQLAYSLLILRSLYRAVGQTQELIKPRRSTI